MSSNNWKQQIALLLTFVVGSTGLVPFSFGDEGFDFFEEEAKVVSASRLPVSRSQSPATVYVVTQEDIKNSGAQTIWDALRGVPGVDVIQSRADQAEISIRGLDKTLNNRTLILLDGKTVMNGYFDFVTWEAIPVTMQEIDRIEVVEGPASAVYGANAVNGVINIITRPPESYQGGEVRAAGGQWQTQIGSLDYGRKNGKLGYRVGGGWRSLDQFSSDGKFASQGGKFNTSLEYAFTPDSELDFSGGVTSFDTQTSAGGTGAPFFNGVSSFARTDYRFRQTKLQAFWNRERSTLEQFAALGDTNLDSDTYQVGVEQSLSLPFRNAAVFGASFRRNEAASITLPPGVLRQDLWALFLEDQWTISQKWSWMVSARVDHHPLTTTMFSPRSSLVWTPVSAQVFRLSAGESFRNPTLLENYLDATLSTPNSGAVFPNPPFTSFQSTTNGNPNLKPERMESIELAHNGQFGRLQTSLVGFHYKLKNIITSSPVSVTGLTPPAVSLFSSYVNSGEVQAWGGEFGLNFKLTKDFSSFANYSYQNLHDSPGDQTTSLQSPRHKANAGFLAKRNRVTGNLWVHWVDSTQWSSTLSGGATADDLKPVSAYFLLNGNMSYAFSGRYQGLEIGISAFNLLNHGHYETLPAVDAAHPGQNGEIIRSRWLATASYKF